jgi:hypothetical protein
LADEAWLKDPKKRAREEALKIIAEFEERRDARDESGRG